MAHLFSIWFSIWSRKPLVHFLLIGLSLFGLQRAGQGYFEPPFEDARKDLVISRNQIEQFKHDISLQTGSRPTSDQLQRLVQAAIDDEVLYQEAIALKLDKNNLSIRQRLIDLAKIAEDSKETSDDLLLKKALDLGFDRHDPVVRRLLISTMRLVAQKVPTRSAPAEVDAQAMEAYYRANAATFTKPAQVKFTHLYFSRDKRGANGKSDAERVLAELSSPGADLITAQEQGGTAQEQGGTAQEQGDVFLSGKDFLWASFSSLERLFGWSFVDGLTRAAPGKWSGPIASSYGWHLVFVEDLRPARPSTFDEAASQIKIAILREREEQRLSETLERLRARYEIVISDDSDASV